MKTQRLILILATIAALLVLAACGGPAATPAPATPAPGSATPAPAAKPAGPQKIVISSWGGDQEKVLREFVIPQLKTQNIEVELALGGSGDRDAKLRAEAGKPSVDLILVDIPKGIRLIQDGLVETPDPSLVKDMPLAPGTVDPKVGYGVVFQELGIRYNPKKIDKPTSWKDLWNPKYKGHVGFGEYPTSFQGIGGMAMVNNIWGGNAEAAEAGFKAMAQLKPFAVIFAGEDRLNSAWTAQDVWISGSLRGYSYAAKEKGDPAEYVVPQEGAVRGLNVALIPKGVKNRDASIKALRAVLSPEAQAGYAKYTLFTPVNTQTKLSAQLEQQVGSQSDVAKQKTFDWEAVVKNTKAWTDMWNKTMN